MSDFNITARDQLNNPGKVFEEMTKFTPNNLRTSRSNRDVSPLNLTTFNLSEILMRIPAFDSPENALKLQEGLIAGVMSSFWDTESMGGFNRILPPDLVAMLEIANPDGDTGDGSGNQADGSGGAEGETIAGSGSSLSPNFNVSDFNSNRGAQVPTAAIDGLRWLCVNILEPMILEFGTCTITSPYRPLAHNRSVGSSDGSRHIYDSFPTTPAVDCRFARGGPDQWLASARRLFAPERGGFGRYSGNFIHIDNRPNRTSWDWR